MDQGTGRYAAFLSYSHKDAADARWLHRRLETYRIPRRLVGTEGERGTVPARLTPIFRDREELPAAGDLSERVRAALAASNNLVILCSPNAAASPWVAKEIAAFRELHPDRPIFAAIVDADPPHCFPPNLAAGGAEPLAADLRPGRDGRRLGLLKLVAGLSGVGLDALVQRDAQRRIRRVTAVTGTALAAMLVMAVTTGIALSERREAQRQRAEAEGLVEFMLTDLRTKLRGVGRLDIMQAVNERALRRYAGEDLNSLGPTALAHRARILRAVGEDEITLGDLDRAEKAFAEAYRITSTQLQNDPSDTSRLEHAHSEYWVGRVYELRRDWKNARSHYKNFADSTAQLLITNQANVDYLTAAAHAAIDLGNLQMNAQDDFDGARQSYRKAATWFAKVAALDPGDPTGLRNEANTYGWLADTYYGAALKERSSGKRDVLWRRSLDERLHQRSILERLQRVRPADMDIAYRAALADRAVGVSYLQTGARRYAALHLTVAYQALKRLTIRDPSNTEWQLGKAMVACNILFAPVDLPTGSSRRQMQAEVISIAETLKIRRNPRAAELDRCLGVIHRNVVSK